MRARWLGLWLMAVLAGCSVDAKTASDRASNDPQNAGGDGDGEDGGDGDGDGDGDGEGLAAGDGDVEPPLSVPDDQMPREEEVANPFVDASKDPFSTFGADVDTASYDYFRQSVTDYQQLPAAEMVRIEDFVNFFKYSYPTPAFEDDVPFAIALAASAHPAGKSTKLVRVGIQAAAAPTEKKPANIVFLVDTSGSMASEDKLPLVKVVLKETLSVLEPTDKVSIVTYAGDVSVRLPPTAVSQKATISAEIDGLESGGGTAGASGINLAYEQASAGYIQGGINHVILCTDGDFNIGVSSDEELVELIKEKRATGVTLTALGFGHGNLNDSMMERVSNAGNGSYSVVYSLDQAIEYANERLLSTIIHVAKDMKIQVEWNPLLVKAYRLLGYEDRAVADDDFRDDTVDGGEVGANHRVTALYEVVLTDESIPAPAGAPALSAGETSDLAPEIGAGELVRVKVRYKQPDATDADPAAEVAKAIELDAFDAPASDDLAWAAAVAGFAEILRGSPFAGSLDAIATVVEAQKDRDGDRGEFAQLFTQARAMLAD